MTNRNSSLKAEQVWLLLILLLGLALRLWGLGSWPWEEDELYTLRDARALPFQVNRLGDPGIAARPVYYLLQHALLALLPPTPLLLRLPALLFGMAGLVATWWVGRRVFGPRAGLVAALLLALSPWHLYASQFARYWTLVYLLSTLTYWALPRAIDQDQPKAYLAVLALILMGGLTHPTFLLPVAGVALAVHLFRPDGQVAPRLPSARAWAFLWGPLAVLGAAEFVTLRLTGNQQAIQNWAGRGLTASLQVIPGMIQWTSVEICGAAIAATAFLVGRAAPDRRWGGMTILGGGGALLLLFMASFSSNVYADYGISVLPLVYLSIGGAVQRIAAEVRQELSGWVVGGASIALAAGVLPGTVSHLSDGSRFDYRPAFAAIRRLDPEHPVAGGIDVIQKEYAPDLRMLEIHSPPQMDSLPVFWFITSERRYGLREGGPGLQAWLNAHCRRVLSSGRPRLDYRIYRVDLYSCRRESAAN